jgi:hypothetical protein
MTVTSDAGMTLTPQSSDSDCSALVTISVPDCASPICRLGGAREILGDLTVRQLIERVVSPSSLLSVRVPMTQLEAEAPTALAVSELLSTDCCEVVLLDGAARGEKPVSLDERAAEITQAQVGAQGSSFLNISLEVRAPAERLAATPQDRRQVATPEVVEVERRPAAELPSVSGGEERRHVQLPGPVEASVESEGYDADLPLVVEADLFAPEEPVPAAEAEGSGPEASEPVTEGGIIAIVAKPVPREKRPPESQSRKEYIRKGDWLRAQFLPEVQNLDFSGLFVGNLGLGIREEHGRRTVVLADPARITDILLRGNSYRRSGDHAKALICYQELVDMDPGNPDFRFLLGKTLLALGQQPEAIEAFGRARELGHEGARKELEDLKAAAPRARKPLGFLRFWKQ